MRLFLRSVIAVVVVQCGIAVIGCSGGTNRVGLDDSGGVHSLGVSSQDFRTVGQTMARSLSQCSEIVSYSTVPNVAFLEITNNSSEFIDTDALLEEIRYLLLQYNDGRYRFIDRDNVEAIIREREARRAGITSSELDTAALASADFFLTGTISSIEEVEDGERSTYLRFSFRLVDAETSAIVWEDRYEIKKVSSRATWDE